MVKEFKAYAQWINPRHAVHEKIRGKYRVELQGYVPLQDRIIAMTMAGQRLYDHRKALYDIQAGIDKDIPVDVTRKPGLDMADASQMSQALVNKYNGRKKAKKPVEEVKKAEKPVEEVKEDDKPS